MGKRKKIKSKKTEKKFCEIEIIEKMYFTRVLNVVRKHTNEFTGIIKDSPDRAYGRRKIKMMTGHYYGRGRNCYMLASRQLQKGLEHATKNRALSRKDFRELCDLRIEAGAKELHYEAVRQKCRRHHPGVRAVQAAGEPRREADQGGGQEPDEGALRPCRR